MQRHLRWGVCVLFLAFVTFPYVAFTENSRLNQYVQTGLTDKNGLPQNSVNAIAQTMDGYIWFGTEEGLARFDGLRVTVFDAVEYRTLLDNYINAIAAGHDGSLWIGTRSGLTRFRNGAFTDYLRARSPISALLESGDGSIWVGGLDGLYQLRSKAEIRHYTTRDGLPGESVNSIVQTQDGTLWIGTNRGLVAMRNLRLHPAGFLDGLSNEPVVSVAASRDGSLWVATTRELLHLDAGAGKPPTRLALPPGTSVSSLLEQRDGDLWVGFVHSGVALVHNGHFMPYTTKQGLPSDDVSTLFEDHDGNLWIGLFEGGTVELRKSPFSTVGRREGLSEDMVWTVLQAKDGSVWVGTDSRGLDHIGNDGRIQTYGTSNGLPAGSVFALCEASDGSIWVGSENGELSHLRHGRITVIRDPANHGARLNSIFEDANGDLLLGYHEVNGFVRFHHGQFQHYQVPGLLNTAAIAPDGSFWIGTDHGGLSHIQNGRVTSVTTRDGLLSDFAQAVYVDRDGVVWAGTSPGGLNRIADGRITTYSIGQGLYDLTVGAIVEDNQGYLWMTCNRGIYKVSKKELNDYADGRIHRIHSVVYTTADGLRSAECNFARNPAVWKGVDGHLWFVTTAGVVAVDPEHSDVRFINPSAVIEEVRFSGSLLPLNEGGTAGPGAGDLEIQFTAPDFTAPDRLRFQYRLVGFDNAWVDAGDRREAIYTKLGPGSYWFEVHAGARGGGWSSTAARIRITIKPHYWQTEWFRVLCGLIVLLAGFGIYRIRVRYLVEYAARLEQRVNERTSELQVAIQTAEEAKRALRDQAMRDGLTGLWNRRAILEMLEGEVARSDRDNLSLCVLMVDIDHFKQINDNSGHLAGDRVLEAIAQCIVQHIRPYDRAGRYGGEEFLVILPGCSLDVGKYRAEEFRRMIAEVSLVAGSGSLQITCSVGLAAHRSHAGTEDLIREADTALYLAKRSGRNCVRVAEELEYSRELN